MTPKGKKNLILTVICIVLMFAWIFVTVGLTGERELEDFNARDWKIFAGFIVIEIATCAVMFVFANKAGKENRKNKPPIAQKPATRTEKTQRSRGLLLTVTAGVLAFGLDILGIVLSKKELPVSADTCNIIVFICIAVPVVLTVLSVYLKKRHRKQLENQKVSEFYEFVQSHRQEAEKTAAEKQQLLKQIRILSNLYAVALFVLGVVMAFCSGVVYNTSNTFFWMVSGMMILIAFGRIRFKTPKAIFTDNKTYVKPEEYPLLHAVAQKAAEAVGCPGRIRISLQPDGNAGIGKIGDTYSIQLGVVLLKTLTQEEIYHILLHEFSHLRQEKTIESKDWAYFNWLNYERTPNFCLGFSDLAFSYPDILYVFHFSLYHYAVSLGIEYEADQAMSKFGDSTIAASSLLKIKYYDLFCWEKEGQDAQSIFETEQLEKNLLTKEIDRFYQAMKNRTEAWNRLAEREIQSRSASHPTVYMRIRALGVSELCANPIPEKSEYIEECDRALTFMEQLIFDSRLEEYEQERKVYYLDPTTEVEAWIAAGRPVTAESYGDMIWNLRQLGRLEEAIELCEKVIEILPNEANHQAYFVRGCYRLHRYEDAGLEDIYFAIENNHNYVEEGMEQIGRFCCLTGNQKELDQYREKAVTLAQRQKDDYSELSYLNKGDKLSPEQLPEGMLERFLEYVISIDTNGSIRNLYLVRKTISETFFTSPVVVKFCEGVSEEERDEIMHKIFRYLDTCSDWQFSLFDYQTVKKANVENIENSCVYSREV